MSDKKQIERKRANGLNKLLKDVFGEEHSIQFVLRSNGFSDENFFELREKTSEFLDAVINSFYIALDDRFAAVLIRRYGLQDGDVVALQTLGVEASLSRDRIRQIEDKAIRRVRNKLEKIILSAASGAIGKPIEQSQLISKSKVRREIRADSLENTEQFISNDPVSRRAFIKRFVREKQGSAENALTNWLMENGLIERSKNDAGKQVTSKGEEFGLINKLVLYDNEQQTKLLLSAVAQKRVLENWNKIIAAKIKEKQPPNRIGKRWDEEEDARLARAYIGGVSVSELAAAHERGSGGIKARLKLHGLVDANGDVLERYQSIDQETGEIITHHHAASVICENNMDAQNIGNILIAFSKEQNELFALTNYISSSMVETFLGANRPHYELVKSKILAGEVDATDVRGAEEFVSVFENITSLVKEHNEKFIDHSLVVFKDYFDNILKDVNSKVMLDDEQRRAILADEDYCLLVAGAGAGKTTTMAAKVKYLVEIKKVPPQDIVVISYTNKAIDELKERINERLKISANITTFHKFGYDLLKSSSTDIPTVEYSAFKYVFECLEKQIFSNKTLLKKVLLFFGYYLNIPEEALTFDNLNKYFDYKANNHFQTIKSSAGDLLKTYTDKRSEQKRTIIGEYVRSNQEVQIANFLYLHGIDYQYEERYPFQINGARKPYLPDFTITQNGKIYYLEHFGISQGLLNNMFSDKQLEKYKASILFKRKLHKDNGTVLIETFSNYNDKRSLLEHLKEQLEEFGIFLNPRSDEEVYKKLVDTSKDNYVYRFGSLILDFIGCYKESGYDKDGFKILLQKHTNVRTKLFLQIAEEVYNYYQDSLKAKNSVDFADMINNAERMLRAAEESQIYLPYKYIIIDEFQDIARQRFNLTKTLANVTGAKIVAVGDDWQSIFAFAGSDITLFQKFLELMGHGIEMQINHTYRNAQELIDIAGGFIQKNPTQIKKRLVSTINIQDPIEIVEYDGTTAVLKNWAKAIDECIERIVKKYGEKKSILLITRFNFEKDRLCESGYFIEGRGDGLIWKKNRNVSVVCLTAHSSKGLGFDNVIIISMKEATFGFPSQLDDDPVLKLVKAQDLSIPYAEERRLFYVALTRTKNKVFMITPQNAPSRFVLELIHDYKIKHSENLSFEVLESAKAKCPMCKATLKYHANNAYGIPLYMCTNDPEICDFMTNSKQVLADIYKCPKCRDGYMVVKESKKNNDHFYGCTGYPDCKNQQSIPDEIKAKSKK